MPLHSAAALSIKDLIPLATASASESRTRICSAAFSVVFAWLMLPYPPSPVPVWQVVLAASALLLTQGLVRDIAILIRSRRSVSNQPRKESQCLCLESSIGITGIIAGAVLAGSWSSIQVTIGRWPFLLAVAGTMTLGFIIRDLVISWHPLGIRREKDHLNLIVRWKSKSKCGDK